MECLHHFLGTYLARSANGNRWIMTANYLSAFVLTPLLGWLVALSVSVVGYLLVLQLREHRRNRRMQGERERLGLSGRRPHHPTAPTIETGFARIRTTGFLVDSPRRLDVHAHAEAALALSSQWTIGATAVQELDSRRRPSQTQIGTKRACAGSQRRQSAAGTNRLSWRN